MRKTILLYALLWPPDLPAKSAGVQILCPRPFPGVFTSVSLPCFSRAGLFRLVLAHRKKESRFHHRLRAFVPNESALQQDGISPREYEVLEGIAQGLLNQEIADKLFFPSIR